MASMEQRVPITVRTMIVKTEARLLYDGDVLVIDEAEAYFVKDAQFTDNGDVLVVLDGHPSFTVPRKSEVLVVRTLIQK